MIRNVRPGLVWVGAGLALYSSHNYGTSLPTYDEQRVTTQFLQPKGSIV